VRTIFTAQAMLFSAKSFLAAMLALYVALSTGQSNPSWAVVTAYVVAQSRAGAVLSKGVYRVIGTVAGAAISVFLTPLLVNAPELLSAAVALWLGLCTFLSIIDRTPRSYMFVLAGLTACVIVFPSVERPDVIFTTAVARAQEITLGIVCSSVVHATILPSSSAELLRDRLNGALRDAARWTADALSATRPETLDQDRRRLAVAVNELYDLLTHAGFESASPSRRRRSEYRALLAQIERLLPLSAAVDDRALELRRAGAMPSDIAALLEEVRDWVTTAVATPASGSSAEAERLQRQCIAREPQPAPGMAWRDALALSLLARLADLILVHENCLALRDAILGGPLDEAARRRVDTLLEAGPRAIERDYAGALATAGSTTVALFIACMLWIASGWSGGASAVTMTGIFFAIYAGANDPTTLLKNKFIGVVIRTLLAVIYVLAILPAISGFPLLVAALAPVLLVSGAAMAIPRYSPLAFNLILGVLNPAIIADRFEPDFASYLNSSLATLAGIYFALIMMRLTQSLWLEGAARRVLRAGWLDIARGRHAAMTQWRGRMGHRLALLAMRAAKTGADEARVAPDAMRDLRTGLSLAELAGIRASLPQETQAEAGAIIDAAARYYRGLARGLDEPPPATLLDHIDRALQTGLESSDPVGQRAAVVSLVSVRRNLFPSALMQQPASAGSTR
jgi:uncharacterized membrane protein YccC